MLRKISITARTMIVAIIMALSLSGVAQAQFEDMFIEQAGTLEQQPGSFARSGWAGSMNPGPSFVSYSSDYNAVKAAIHTPQQASAYMQENFTYQQDFRINAFTPVSPTTLNDSKWGDCKDFAVFAADVLSDDGIRVNPIAVRYGSGSSTFHVMSVANYNGAAYLFSNQDIWQVGSNEQILSIASQNLTGGNARDMRYYEPSYRGEFRY